MAANGLAAFDAGSKGSRSGPQAGVMGRGKVTEAPKAEILAGSQESSTP